MRILLLTVTTGQGHNRAAAALREAMERRGHQIVEADLYRRCAGGLAWKGVDFVYRFSAAHLKRLYRRSYARLERDPRAGARFLRTAVPPRLCDALATLVAEQRPDRILCTHVFAARALSLLAADGRLSAPFYGIVTDYCLHPLWEDCPGLRGLVLAAPELTAEAVSRGIPAEILLPLGIPVRAGFRTGEDPSAVRKTLGLADAPTVLLMGGSMGYGRLGRTALALRRLRGVQTICVCGSNRLLRWFLTPWQNRRLRVLGYTEALDAYMAAADLAVTKPGGLTLTELALQGLPALLIDPIPGHEDRNLRFMVRRGGARAAGPRSSRPGKTAAAALDLLRDPAALRAMSQAQKAAVPAQAASRICQAVTAAADDFQKTKKSLDKV